MLDFPVDTPACPTCTVHLQEAKRVLSVRVGGVVRRRLGVLHMDLIVQCLLAWKDACLIAACEQALPP